MRMSLKCWMMFRTWRENKMKWQWNLIRLRGKLNSLQEFVLLWRWCGLIPVLEIHTLNSQNASDFDNLQVRKISTTQRLQVRIIHACLPNKRKEFASGLTSLLVKKILLAKLCKCTKKLTSSPVILRAGVHCLVEGKCIYWSLQLSGHILWSY